MESYIHSCGHILLMIFWAFITPRRVCTNLNIFFTFGAVSKMSAVCAASRVGHRLVVVALSILKAKTVGQKIKHPLEIEKFDVKRHFNPLVEKALSK